MKIIHIDINKTIAVICIQIVKCIMKHLEFINNCLHCFTVLQETTEFNLILDYTFLEMVHNEKNVNYVIMMQHVVDEVKILSNYIHFNK